MASKDKGLINLLIEDHKINFIVAKRTTERRYNHLRLDRKKETESDKPDIGLIPGHEEEGHPVDNLQKRLLNANKFVKLVSMCIEIFAVFHMHHSSRILTQIQIGSFEL